MNRCLFLRGLAAAPAVVPICSLMPIRGTIMPVPFTPWPTPQKMTVPRGHIRATWHSSSRGESGV